MSENNVLVVGTGTIGLPLIGLLTRHRERFGIDNVLFNKNTPLPNDSPQIKQMLNLGAKLVTDRSKFDGFKALDMHPYCEKEEAIGNATVVIDCTPSGIGLANKKEYYTKYSHKVKGFVAQGSEFGFGKMYACGVTELKEDDQFVQVVSCNTHNIAALLKSLEDSNPFFNSGDIISGDFVCLRRANDISQDDDFIASTSVEKHKDSDFGTHHARDAFYLLKDQFPDMKLYSSAVKLNTQYMHSIRFSITLYGKKDLQWVKDKFRSNPYVAVTQKKSANTVFSFGRDYGLYGRILSQTVIIEPTLSVRHVDNTTIVTGFCFTPQDGNSLLSSIAATLHFIDPTKASERLNHYTPYLFKEI